MNRILFLDFDGVLHPVGTGSLKFSQLGLLADFLREPAHADVEGFPPRNRVNLVLADSKTGITLATLEQLRARIAEK